MDILYGILYVFVGYQGITSWFAARKQFITANSKRVQVGALIIAGIATYLLGWGIWHMYLLVNFAQWGIF